MALIKCPECGKEISDKALTCPGCGVPINMKVPIMVTFIKKKHFGVGANIDIYIDDQFYGGLSKGGSSFAVELSQGRHVVDLVHTASNIRATNELIIPDDANEVLVEIDSGAFGPKIINIEIS